MEKKYYLIFYLGSHFVGEIAQEDEENLIMNDCCRLILTPNETGTLALTVIPLSKKKPFVDGVKFKKDLITLKEDGRDIHDQLKMARSRIVTPTQTQMDTIQGRA